MFLAPGGSQAARAAAQLSIVLANRTDEVEDGLCQARSAVPTERPPAVSSPRDAAVGGEAAALLRRQGSSAGGLRRPAAAEQGGHGRGLGRGGSDGECSAARRQASLRESGAGLAETGRWASPASRTSCSPGKFLGSLLLVVADADLFYSTPLRKHTMDKDRAQAP